MTTKHTPGPWGIIWTNGTIVIDANGGKTDIAHVVNRVNRDITEANARLIAAAPELLSALRSILDWGREHTSPTEPNSPHGLLVAAHLAIAKAETGETAPARADN